MNEAVSGDTAGHFPDMESARAYASGDNPNTTSGYHQDRMRALRLLLDSAGLGPRVNILDFGCGDGMYIKEFFTRASVESVVGVDISGPMVTLASERLAEFSFKGVVGGAGSLVSVDGSFDLCLAIDVLGYLQDDEVDEFYRSVARLVRPGGKLIVMYGNELLDLYALNSGTTTFFQKYFDADASDLLTEGRSPKYNSVVRKNPLSFGAEIAPYGFDELAQAFSQWHNMPPGIGNRAGDVAVARMNMRNHAFDPNGLPPKEKWKALFRSSIFASLSERRIDA